MNHFLTKLFLTWIAVAALGGVAAYAQSTDPKLIPFEADGKWGYIDSKGKVIIQPRFDEAQKFSEGLALVDIGLNSGFIDESGRFAIEPKFRCGFGFAEGLAPVAEDCESLWGYIDKTGKYVIQPRFEWAGKYSEGMAKVLLAPKPDAPGILKTGYINKAGVLVIPAKYGWAESFSSGFALIAADSPSSSEKFGNEYFNERAFIDKTGTLATPFFKSAESFSEGLAPVEIDSLWGFIDTKGKLVIKPEYDFVLRGFENGFAAVNCVNDKIAFINKVGRKLTGCEFSEAFPFSEGLASVQVPNKGFGFINTKGRFVIAPKFSFADSFYNGLAKVRVNRKGVVYEGFIDHKGRYVIGLKKRSSEDTK